MHGSIAQSTYSPLCSPPDSPRRRASLHSIGYRSSENNETLLTFNHNYSAGPSSQASYSNIAAGYQPTDEQADADDDIEQPHPTLLGSFDYHDFLCRSSNRRTALTMSPATTVQPHAFSLNNSAKMVFKSRPRSSQGTPAPTPTHQLAFQQAL